MITKCQLYALDEVAWKASSLNSYALFTRSLFKVISINKEQNLGSIYSV